MERSLSTVSVLKALGYSSTMCLKSCGCEELPCPLLTWLVSQIWRACPETLGNQAQDSKSGVVLAGELKALLTKMDCPYPALINETLSPTLLFTLTDFLASELLAVRILHFKDQNPDVKDVEGGTVKEQREREKTEVHLEEDLIAEGQEDEIEQELAGLLEDLGLELSSQLSHACKEVESRLNALPGGVLPGPLLKTSLDSQQWRCLQGINHALIKDYECRRQMMIKRFHVTLQSFTWGERGKERSELLSSMAPLAPLSLGSRVSPALLLATQTDQSRILPVKAGPSTAVHKVLMGVVPDRGGRPGEIEPPMPAWEGRREGRGKGFREARWGKSGRKSKKRV